MICFIAFGVFAILGIFSATHRELANEAFDCVFRKVTLRKCQTGLDSRIKVKMTGPLLKKTPKLGRFVFKHFQVFSWILTIITVWSVVSIAVSGYNFYAYGNCNGPNEDGFCVFDPTGENTGISSSSTMCLPGGNTPDILTIEQLDRSALHKFQEGTHEVIFIGCYDCEFTQKAYPAIMKLMEQDTAFYFAHFPVKEHTKDMTKYLMCLEPDQILQVNNLVFLESTGFIQALENIGVDQAELLTCVNSELTQEKVDQQFSQIKNTYIYGTPTVFVDGQAVVGPKPHRVYKRLLK